MVARERRKSVEKTSKLFYKSWLMRKGYHMKKEALNTIDHHSSNVGLKKLSNLWTFMKRYKSPRGTSVQSLWGIMYIKRRPETVLLQEHIHVKIEWLLASH